MNLVARAGRVWSITLFLLLLLTSDATAQLLDQTDNQFWSEVQLAVPVTKTIDFNIIGQVRVGRDFSHPVDERIGVGFTYRAGKYVTVAPHYLHIGMQPFAGRRIWENRLVLPVTVRFNVGKFRLSDRNQYERRLRNSGINTNRYRNRVGVEHPIGSDKLGLTGFVADEVFYDGAFDRWTRNRFGVGVTKVFNKNFTQDFYYLRQNDSFSVPGDLNVIGTILRIKL
ncbi:MAG TPA: DUF2490 domain-containing protein [Pyrinomonadaceae bacterium]|nr:DUF2490 domain-containing protein [Pyrinomonadaceae bacterium]